MAKVESLQDLVVLVAQTIMFHWGLTAGLALLLYGPLRRWLAHRKITRHQHTLRHVLTRELPWSLGTLLIASGLTLAVSLLSQRGVVHIDTESGVSPLRVAAEVAAYVACYDVYFYFLHRLLHQDPWYRWIHWVHHVSPSPSVATAFVFHPVEAVLTGGFAVTLFALHDFHQFSITGIGLVGAGVGVLVHSGHELLPGWWSRVPLLRLMVSPTFHDRHHAEENCHYGAFTVVMDQLFGTSRMSTLDPARPSGLAAAADGELASSQLAPRGLATAAPELLPTAAANPPR